jgi:hypothetical protein
LKVKKKQREEWFIPWKEKRLLTEIVEAPRSWLVKFSLVNGKLLRRKWDEGFGIRKGETMNNKQKKFGE